jgi:hypothetical protein
MTFIHDYPPLQALLTTIDHIDVKVVDVATAPGELCLREFIAGFIAYNPGWMHVLYRIRAGFVRLLGMRQDGIPQAVRYRAADIPMTPGAKLSFFTVDEAAEGRHWIASASESHLTAYLGVVLEPHGTGSRLHVVTLVKYNSWAGPVYFNVIRPFHHLVVRQMLRAGAQHLAQLNNHSAATT